MSQIKVGDIVVINEDGNCWPYYGDWAYKYNLTQFKYGCVPNDERMEVVCIHEHEVISGELIYGCRRLRDGQEFLMTLDGIVLAEAEEVIKIGDTVKVVNRGQVYSNYVEWAQKHGLEKYVVGKQPDNGDFLKVICIHKHEYQDTDIYGCERCGDGRHFLMDIQGIVLISSSPRIEKTDWNTVCPCCNAPAYQGLFSIECSKGCK